MQQQESLITEPQPITAIRLQADSPRMAWYELELRPHGNGGYLIVKRSGAGQSKGVAEIWFRATLQAARDKYQQQLQRKLNKKRGRIYKQQHNDENQHTEPQPSL